MTDPLENEMRNLAAERVGRNVPKMDKGPGTFGSAHAEVNTNLNVKRTRDFVDALSQTVRLASILDQIVTHGYHNDGDITDIGDKLQVIAKLTTP